MLRKHLVQAVLLLISSAVFAEESQAPVESKSGTLPIILTVPHGGDLKPASILSRRYGVTAKDSNTVELSLMLAEELEQLCGGRPSIVICRLHRSKVDCNRELAEAAQGDVLATTAWKAFHQAAEDHENEVTRKHGRGLVLDIHGHRHEEARVELGYLLPKTLLNEVTDADLNRNDSYLRTSSIRHLASLSPHGFATLIRGPQSLGGMLQKKGFSSVPSPAIPSPGTASYFSGAYGITAHGSRDGGSISAIQVECPWKGVRDTPANQRRFAKAFAACLGTYFEVHFQMALAPATTQPLSR